MKIFTGVALVAFLACASGSYAGNVTIRTSPFTGNEPGITFADDELSKYEVQRLVQEFGKKTDRLGPIPIPERNPLRVVPPLPLEKPGRTQEPQQSFGLTKKAGVGFELNCGVPNPLVYNCKNKRELRFSLGEIDEETKTIKFVDLDGMTFFGRCGCKN